MSLASKERLPQLKLPMIPQREDGFVVGSMALPLPCPPTLAKSVEPLQPKTRVAIARPFPLPPPVESVNPDDTSRLLVLGYGSSAKVYKVRHRTTGKVYALKLIRAKHDASVRRQILRETHILQCVRSPFVVACHGVSDHGGEISFVLEFMDGGSLAHVLECRKTLPEPYLAEVAKQVLQGLFYLHSNKIVHRDLKPSNLLLNRDRQVKIADFGVSTVLTSTLAPCDSFVGTCAYMSPERFDPDSYGGKYDGCSADIWSLGLTLLECFIGYFPFITPGQKADWPTLMVAICFGDPPAPPPTASPEFRSFIKHCLQKDASKRLSASQLLSHPFLTKYEENPCDLSALMQTLQI